MSSTLQINSSTIVHCCTPKAKSSDINSGGGHINDGANTIEARNFKFEIPVPKLSGQGVTVS